MAAPSTTFNLYIFKTFAHWLLGMVLGLSFVIFLVDLVELLRRTSSLPDVTVFVAALMSLLRVPELLMEVLPILVLFAAIGALWWRSRSHELIVARATGLSLWQFLTPIMLTALIFGAAIVALFHPVALLSDQKLQSLEQRYFGNKTVEATLRISSTGTWLREHLSEGSYRLVRARKVQQNGEVATLSDVDVFIISNDSSLLLSWHADMLIFADGAMKLSNVRDQTDPDVPEPIEDQTFTTKLVLKDLYEHSKGVREVNFWKMPALIARLNAAGVSSRETELKFVKLLVLPLTLVSMVLLAAVFSLRMTRSGGVGKMILSGVTIALLLHFLTDILYSFALAGTLPVTIAVASVPLALICACSFFLLEQEDG